MRGMSKCPVCKKAVLPRRKNPAFPFCSERCRAIDLGKWLGEEYRVPGPPADRWPEGKVPGEDPDSKE